MLFKDLKKEPVKRDDITQLVLGAAHKGKKDLFNIIITESKKRLRTIFGYELTQIDRHARGSSDTKGANSTSSSTSQQLWILRFVEPPEMTAQENKNVATNRRSNNDNNNEDGDEDESAASRIESIVTNERKRYAEMQKKSDAPKMGLLIVILSLIQMNEDVIGEDLLYERLKCLGIHRSDKRHEVFGDIERTIEQFTKQFYLDKDKDEIATEAEAEDHGGRRKNKYAYRAGSRAEKEISKQTITHFITQICTDDNNYTSTADEPTQRRQQASSSSRRTSRTRSSNADSSSDDEE